MNATVTISQRHLLSGRDTEPNPPHPLMEEGLVLVPAAEDSLLLRGHMVIPRPCVPVLEQQKLTVNI